MPMITAFPTPTPTPTSASPAARLRRAACATCLALAAGFAGGAERDAAPEAGDDAAFYRRAATCAAALEIDQLALVARARAGTPGLRADIVRITQLGFAYVGTAYKRGLRNPAADQMLHDARSAQKSWSAARHASVSAECRGEAEKIYNDATSMEQWFVTRRANSRVDKFFAAAAPAAAAASLPPSSAGG